MHGEACLKSLEQPQTPLLIPQPDETVVSISLHPIDKMEKKLGVFTCLIREFLYHVGQLKNNGLEYASCPYARQLPPHNASMGTRYQLYPKLMEEVFQLVWYNLLPSIKVNRHITRGFHTLPLRFQGLMLPNPNIDVLS
jgi:hypothetical protein